MANDKRTCDACGRPITGRKRRWCGHPDCGGWNSVYVVRRVCECGKSYETIKGREKTRCHECIPYEPPLWICIECKNPFHTVEGVTVGLPGKSHLWCTQECHDEYFTKNPPPDFFAEEKERSRDQLCLLCVESLSHSVSACFCSTECDAIFNAREKYKREEHEILLQKESPEKAKAFTYARQVQLRDLLVEIYSSSLFSGKEYQRLFSQEMRKMEVRRKMNLPEDAPLPDKTIPLTTEIPIKIWLEENGIEFEVQYYIEYGSTWTHVDFFILLPDSDKGICLYCDGDYWHGPEFPETQEKDKIQVRELEALGHKVIRLRESEIQEGKRPTQIFEFLK